MIDDKMCLVSSSLLQSSNGQPRSIYFGDRLQNCNVQHRYDMFLLKHCVFPALFFFFSLIFISTLSGCATTNGVSKPIKELNDGSETVCSQEDYVNRVSAADHCLAIDIYTSPARTINPTLITFVHGDSLNTKGQKYINAFLRAYPDAHEEDFIFIAITRPGYSNGRETSTGQHYYYEGDAYRAHTVMAVSEAIMKLKEHYNAGRLVVMGHSGGANILANGLGYNEAFKPDTAILLSGSYYLEKWAKHRDLYRWYQGRGLSPHEHIESISEDVEIIALTGENDENALPEFARDYVEQLSSAGKNATFTEIRNAGHDDIFRSVDMWKLLKDKLF